MKKFAIALFLGLFLAPCLHAQTEKTDVRYTFSTVLSAAGQTEAYSTIADTNYSPVITFPRVQAVQVFVTGTPSSCSFTLYGSLKKLSETPASTDYQALSSATDCTTTTLLFVVDHPVASVLVKLTALTGGTSPTVTFMYLGKL